MKWGDSTAPFRKALEDVKRLRQEVAELEQENERLRAWLETIHGQWGPTHTAYHLAQLALSGASKEKAQRWPE